MARYIDCGSRLKAACDQKKERWTPLVMHLDWKVPSLKSGVRASVKMCVTSLLTSCIGVVRE